jgi:nucleoside-diphosphate kinase
MTADNLEQTLVLIKPDALKNSLTGYVLSQLSEFHTGLCFAGAKIVCMSQMLAEAHYAEHLGKTFFPSLVEYIRGQIHFPDAPGKRRVIALVYHGPSAIQKIRNIAGPTNPHIARDKNPGCIRALGTIAPIYDAAGNVIDERMDNLIHASANKEDAEREVKLWFQPLDIPPQMRTYATEVIDTSYYYKANRIFTDYKPGSICLIAAGQVVWKTDAEILRTVSSDGELTADLKAVIAKYLINEDREVD